MRLDVTLRNGKARRFQEIKDELSQELGYEPSRPEVMGYLMGNWNGPEENRLYSR